MKTFRTVGSGNTQSLEPIENNKIPVYETKTAAEADLANLEVGQIIATKDEGNELSNPVDVVQDGNMHAVTSNAVASVLSSKCTTQNINNSQTKGVLVNRVDEGIVTINAYDSTGSGLSIDFNFTSNIIAIHKIVNGDAVERKYAILTGTV